MAEEENKTALGDGLKSAGYDSEGGEVGKRKPGRPPKTTAGVNNTADTYEPSIERNNVDQALQPTGEGETAGLGGSSVSDGPESEKKEPFGGKGDHDSDGKVGGANKFFPVTLKRNYRPLSDTNWRIITENGDMEKPPTIEDGSSPKAKAGYKIGLPIEEAKDIIRRGIADRADEIE